MCNARESKIKRVATQLIENRKAMTNNMQQTTCDNWQKLTGYQDGPLYEFDYRDRTP